MSKAQQVSQILYNDKNAWEDKYAHESSFLESVRRSMKLSGRK